MLKKSLYTSEFKREAVKLAQSSGEPIAKTSIFNYIENYYNRGRRHSAINYMILDQFEKLELMA